MGSVALRLATNTVLQDDATQKQLLGKLYQYPLRMFQLLLILPIALFIAYQIYAYIYFNGEKFGHLRKKIWQYTNECNDLNDHIEQLKYDQSYAGAIDYGSASLSDNSRYNFKRSNWSQTRNTKFVHNCSASVCKKAGEQPFKYLCKYFGVKPNEEGLENYESIFNDFAAAEQGKSLLVKQKNELIASISGSIPWLIKRFNPERLERKLGFEPVDLGDYYVPVYSFQYVSSGGNSSMTTAISLDARNLERFIGYLADLVKFRKSAAGQRALMTQSLRNWIKERDDYTCQMCGLSTSQEKNLLLEIDHILPVSKGGITSENNLQTLCWKCNRSKGSKVLT